MKLFQIRPINIVPETLFFSNKFGASGGIFVFLSVTLFFIKDSKGKLLNFEGPNNVDDKEYS